MVNSQPESVIVEGDATLNSLKSLGGGPVLNDSVNLWVVSWHLLVVSYNHE